jgi:hypothetical protein
LHFVLSTEVQLPKQILNFFLLGGSKHSCHFRFGKMTFFCLIKEIKGFLKMLVVKKFSSLLHDCYKLVKFDFV